ncbi:MAG TPA: Rv3235 family protein [Natronosporangium sp.]|nr:Rv3235 family protein [Natronosporangium sp.]
MATVEATRPSIRLQPAPVTDPPYDDDRDPRPRLAVLPQPPLPFRSLEGGRRHRPTPPSPPPRRQPVVPLATRREAARFLNACLEIWNGYRPATHIRALCEPVDALAIEREMAEAVRRLSTVTSRLRCRVVVRRVRVCQPRTGAMEISAVIGTAGRGSEPSPRERAWAAAFRLEQRHGRWHCRLARLL